MVGGLVARGARAAEDLVGFLGVAHCALWDGGRGGGVGGGGGDGGGGGFVVGVGEVGGEVVGGWRDRGRVAGPRAADRGLGGGGGGVRHGGDVGLVAAGDGRRGDGVQVWGVVGEHVCG